MKKKIPFILLITMLCTSFDLIAQNWQIGGNNVPVGGGQLGSNNNRPVIFETNNVERGRITGNGRFGFGLTNPQAKVHIRSGATQNPLQVDIGNVAALLVDAANSRVGIGTTAPTAKLSVNSAAGEDGLRVQINGSTKLLVDNGGGVSVGSTSLAPANGLFVSGNAGIGTSVPAVKLHVTGGTDAAPASGGFIVTGFTTSANISIDDNEIMARSNGAASTLTLNNNGGNLIIDGTNVGSLVGIGTSTPSQRLHVVGNIFATGNLDVSGSIGFGSVETLTDGGANTIASNSTFRPTIDNGSDLGTPTFRWNEVWAVDGTINTSDLRDKTNVRDLEYGIKEIMQLRSIRFNWKNNPQGEKLGLVAQDLQKVLPEVVRDAEYKINELTGQKEKVTAQRLGVAYADIIPVLIRGMQQQQETILALENRISKLEAALNNNTSSKNYNSGASLEQNQPNPFNHATLIRYKIPDNANAQIMIYDAAGRLVKTLQANQSGQSQINAGELRAGNYTYSLMVNGQVAASKTMVLVK